MHVSSRARRPSLRALAAALLAASIAVQPSLAEERAAHEHVSGRELAPGGARHDLSIYQLDAIWRDDRGEPMRLGALQGRPVVLTMIYTSCQYVCPVLVEDVERIAAALQPAERERVHFVLVSFDPARDTPEALAAYRAERGLAADRWVLLTGEDDDVLALAAVLGVRFKPDGRGDFAHSNLVSVLDAEGVLRHQQVGIGRDRDATVAALRELLPR